MLVDAHLHLVDRSAPGVPPAADGAVFVESGAKDPLEEALWASQQRGVLGVVAGVRLDDPARDLDALQQVPGLVGVRDPLAGSDVSRFAGLAPGLRELGGRGLTFDALVDHVQLPALSRLLATAEVAVVVDHAGRPPIGDPSQFGVWLAGLEELARNDWVAVKLSGLFGLCPPGTPDLAEACRPWLSAALDVFGPERSMVGSDWPVSTRGPLYEQWFALILDGLGLSGFERDSVSSGTATLFYGLGG